MPQWKNASFFNPLKKAIFKQIMATKTQQSGSSFVAIKISKAQAGAQQVRVHILYGRLCVHTKCLCQLNATSALMHHGERLKTVFPPERKGRA